MYLIYSLLLIRHLKAKHKQTALQWIPGHCQITGNEQADALAKKGAKLHKHIIETSYHSVELHLNRCSKIYTDMNYRQGSPINRGSKKHPNYQTGLEERQLQNFDCVGHDCLGTHLHGIGIHPGPYCMLRSLREPMDRNHLGQCTALLNRTECERYWEARIKMMEN